VQNSLTDSANRAVIDGSCSGGGSTRNFSYFYLGFTRPTNGFKFYVDSVDTKNSTSSSATMQYWNGTAWTAVGSFSDGTKATDAVFSQDGVMSFDDTASTAKISGIDGVFLYWYRLIVSAEDNGIEGGQISQVTARSAMQSIKDVWDGGTEPCLSVKLWSNSEYNEFTGRLLEDDWSSGFNETFLDLGSASSGHYVIYGFNERMQGVSLDVRIENTNAANALVYYSDDGTNWNQISNIKDGTAFEGKTMNRSGVISWNPIGDVADFKSQAAEQFPFHYYRIGWDNTLSTTVHLNLAEGIRAPREIKGYKYAIMAKNRVWLINEKSNKKNSVLVGATGVADVYNGEDTMEFLLGDESDLTGGISLYSVVGANLYETVLFFKKDAMFGVIGDTPENFRQFEIEVKDGLVAPYTVRQALLEAGEAPHMVVIWQGAKGVYMYDNKIITPISNDLDNFFDPRQASNANKISTTLIDESYGFVDTERGEYHWLFADASSTGNLNREFVFDLRHLKWFEIDRGTSGALQSGYEVVDSNKNRYMYGTLRNGIVNRLENGNDLAGNAIAHEMWTGDMVLDEGKINMLTGLRKLKLVAKSTTSTSNTMTVSHYVDSRTTASSTFVLSSIDTGNRLAVHSSAKKSLSGKPAGVFHSIKINMSSTNEEVGFSPIFLGGHFHRVREDI
jgi:hypothetical protein